MFGTDEIEIKLLEPYKKTYKIRGNLRTIKKNKHTSMCKVFFYRSFTFSSSNSNNNGYTKFNSILTFSFYIVSLKIFSLISL